MGQSHSHGPARHHLFQHLHLSGRAYDRRHQHVAARHGLSHRHGRHRAPVPAGAAFPVPVLRAVRRPLWGHHPRVARQARHPSRAALCARRLMDAPFSLPVRRLQPYAPLPSQGISTKSLSCPAHRHRRPRPDPAPALAGRRHRAEPAGRLHPQRPHLHRGRGIGRFLPRVEPRDRTHRHGQGGHHLQQHPAVCEP